MQVHSSLKPMKSILLIAAAALVLSAGGASASGISASVAASGTHPGIGYVSVFGKDGFTGLNSFAPSGHAVKKPMSLQWMGCNAAKSSMCNWGYNRNPWTWYIYLPLIGPWPYLPAWVGEAFSMATNTKVNSVSVAAGYISGQNSLNIALYTDAGGVPGSPIVSQDVTNLAAIGTCCGYSTIKFKTVELTAGTQYWVVLSTDPSSTGTSAGIYLNSLDTIDPVQMAYNNGDGWETDNTNPAFNMYLK